MGPTWGERMKAADVPLLPLGHVHARIGLLDRLAWPAIALHLPGALQDMEEGIVAFVARVFERRGLRSVERHLPAPGPGVERRILDRELVEDLAVRPAAEPLCELSGRRDVGPLLLVDVHRLDDKR